MRISRRDFIKLAAAASAASSLPGSQGAKVDAATPRPAPKPPAVARPVPAPPIAASDATAAWQSIPYDPVTVKYFDSRPAAQFVGSANGRIPYGSKHTRGAYRPADGRLYFGGGDHSCGNTGLPDDAGSSSANPAFYSMDPANPAVVTVEQHRYLRGPIDAIQPSAADEGAFAWNTTNDTLICSPVDAFDMFAAIESGLIPTFVSATRFSLPGDLSARFYIGQRFRLLLDHPDFPGFTADRWPYIPSWFDARVTAVAVQGSATIITFTPRPDLPALAFDRDAKGISLGIKSNRNNVWLDNGQVWYRPSDKTYHAGLLEWDPSTRVWTRVDFKIGQRLQGGRDIGYPSQAYFNCQNGVFVPASVSGRGDEFICIDNRGPDFGWWGAIIFEYNTRTVNFYVMNEAGRPTHDYATRSLSLDQPAYDPIGKKIYLYSAAEVRLYAFDIVTRQVSVLIDKLDPKQPAGAAGCGHSVWNDTLRVIEIYADSPVAGFGCPTLYLVDPATKAVHVVGNSLPNCERIRGDEFYRAGDYTIADGGQFNPDGTEGIPPNRHIFIGKALHWKKLEIAPHKRIAPVRANPAATDMKAATSETSVPFRNWGGFVVSRNGQAYYRGGAHTEYAGNEIDCCNLAQIQGDAMSWEQYLGPPFDGIRRLHVAPASDPVYGSTQSNYLWHNLDGWQAGTQHVYTRATVHPTLGLLTLNKIPANGIMPTNDLDAVDGVWTWNRATGKYQAQFPFDSSAGVIISDWNHDRGTLLIISTDGDITDLREWSTGQSSPKSRGRLAGGGFVKGGPVLSGSAGYQQWAHWLEGDTYLILVDNQNTPDGRSGQLYVLDAATMTATNLKSTAFKALFASSSEGVYTAADHDHRKIWFLVGKDSQPVELYYSAFEDPGNVKRMPMAPSDFRIQANAKTGSGHCGLAYWNNTLWIPTPSQQLLSDNSTRGTDFWRMPVF